MVADHPYQQCPGFYFSIPRPGWGAVYAINQRRQLAAPFAHYPGRNRGRAYPRGVNGLGFGVWAGEISLPGARAGALYRRLPVHSHGSHCSLIDYLV